MEKPFLQAEGHREWVKHLLNLNGERAVVGGHERFQRTLKEDTFLFAQKGILPQKNKELKNKEIQRVEERSNKNKW